MAYVLTQSHIVELGVGERVRATHMTKFNHKHRQVLGGEFLDALTNKPESDFCLFFCYLSSLLIVFEAARWGSAPQTGNLSNCVRQPFKCKCVTRKNMLKGLQLDKDWHGFFTLELCHDLRDAIWQLKGSHQLPMSLKMKHGCKFLVKQSLKFDSNYIEILGSVIKGSAAIATAVSWWSADECKLY